MRIDRAGDPLPAERLRSLPTRHLLGIDVPVAEGFTGRLLGLSFLDRTAAGNGLLIPRCRSVHTFGMQFSLDIHFLDEHGRALASHLATPPGRLLFCRGAMAVLELVSAEGGEV